MLSQPHLRTTIETLLGHARAIPPERRAQLHERIADAMEAVPGVIAAGAVNFHPLSVGSFLVPVVRAGEVIPPENPPTALFRPITSDYLATMGIELLTGRSIERSDRQGSEAVAVVNATLAHRLFADTPAVGRSIDLFGSPYRIVGVSAETHEFPLSNGGDGVLYVPYGQIAGRLVPVTSTFEVRGHAMRVG